MKYFLTYNSQTGNTAILANIIQEYLSSYNQYFNTSLEDCDLLCIGFWCDKGTSDQETSEFLKDIHNKKIFLFGTAGFGDNDEYFDNILNRVQSHIDNSNKIVGSFMCQGKMPQSVRDRYIHMAESNLERFEPLIENFDKALYHPNEDDIIHLQQTLKDILKDS